MRMGNFDCRMLREVEIPMWLDRSSFAFAIMYAIEAARTVCGRLSRFQRCSTFGAFNLARRAVEGTFGRTLHRTGGSVTRSVDE